MNPSIKIGVYGYIQKKYARIHLYVYVYAYIHISKYAFTKLHTVHKIAYIYTNKYGFPYVDKSSIHIIIQRTYI